MVKLTHEKQYSAGACPLAEATPTLSGIGSRVSWLPGFRLANYITLYLCAEALPEIAGRR